MQMDAEDRQFLETKFTGVYRKIDDTHGKLLERIDETRKELSRDIKNGIREHEKSPCRNVNDHYEKAHKGQTARVIIIFSLFGAGVLGIIEVIRRLLK